MECVQNLLLGGPVYDERGQLVRREYGLKNALALFVLGYIAYTLYCSMGKKVFSGKGKGKMKGGSRGPLRVIITLLFGVCIVLWSIFLLGVGPFDWPFVKGSAFGWALSVTGFGFSILLFYIIIAPHLKGFKQRIYNIFTQRSSA